MFWLIIDTNYNFAARPTTKSILAAPEQEFLTGTKSKNDKYQFMHEPQMFRDSLTTVRPIRHTTATAERKPPSFASHSYPQLAQGQSDHDDHHGTEHKHQLMEYLRPNFNNKEDLNVTRFDPLAALFTNQFTITTTKGSLISDLFSLWLQSKKEKKKNQFSLA